MFALALLHGFLSPALCVGLQVMSHGAQSAGQIHGQQFVPPLPLNQATSPMTISSMDDSPTRPMTPAEDSIMRALHRQLFPTSLTEVGARPNTVNQIRLSESGQLPLPPGAQEWAAPATNFLLIRAGQPQIPPQRIQFRAPGQSVTHGTAPPAMPPVLSTA